LYIQKIKAKTSATIAITIALILFSCNAWEHYNVPEKDFNIAGYAGYIPQPVEPPPVHQYGQD